MDELKNVKYYIAVRNRDFKKTKEMIDNGEVEVTELWGAIKSGNLDIVKKFIGEFNKNDIDSFELAVAMGNLDVVKLLIAYGADMHERYDRPFVIAAEEGNISILQYFIEQGVDIHEINLALSRAWHQEKVVEYLKLYKKTHNDI